MSPAHPGLDDRLAAVRAEIAAAATGAGRSTDELTLIVVSKFQPASLVRSLHAAGVRDFGESRHQEAAVKSEELSDLDLTWHFVGQLQSKKAKAVRRYARVIHSVDRDSLVTALDDGSLDDGSLDDATEREATDVFVQVDLSGQPARGGIQESDVERMTERLLAVDSVRLLGVMTVAPIDVAPRAAFARLRLCSERMRRLAPAAVAISAGMSGDFAEAILEGATHLRVGTAITGNRPPAG